VVGYKYPIGGNIDNERTAMPKPIEAITPQEVHARRLEKQLESIEQLNKATTMINGRLNLLERGVEEDFSFIREGFNHDILDALASRFANAGWHVEVYRNQGVDSGLIILWPQE
jgi:hypothetical protein